MITLSFFSTKVLKWSWRGCICCLSIFINEVLNEGKIHLTRPRRKRKKQGKLHHVTWHKKHSLIEKRSAVCERLQGVSGWSRALLVWFADIALSLSSSFAPFGKTRTPFSHNVRPENLTLGSKEARLYRAVCLDRLISG